MMRRGSVKRAAVAMVSVATVVAVCVAGSLAGYTSVAEAANRDDLVADQNAKADEIDQLKADLEAYSADIREAVLALHDTRTKIPVAEQELATAQSELSAARREAETKAALLKAAQNELDGIKDSANVTRSAAREASNSMAEIARAVYRGDDLPSTVELLMNSATPEEFTNAYRAQIVLSRSQSTALAHLEQEFGQVLNRQSRQDAVAQRVVQLKRDADELVTLQQEKEAAATQKRDQLNALETTIEEKSAYLESKKAEIEATVAAEEQEYEAIKAKIAAIDEENRRKAAEAAASASPNYGSGGSSSFLQWPVPGYYQLTSAYGYRTSPIYGGTEFHGGIDIGVPCGVPQRAPAAGTVTTAGWTGGGGNMVYINHGYVNGASWQTGFAHYSSVAVSVGQYVQAGDVIGYTGSTGWSTGCHMHFEVWKNGSTINPLSMF